MMSLRFSMYGILGLFAIFLVLVARDYVVNVQAQSLAGTLAFGPAQGRIDAGTPLNVAFIVGTSDQEKVNVARLRVSYNPSLVQVSHCAAGDGYHGIAGQTACRDANGLLNVNVQSANAEGKSGNVVLATAQFRTTADSGWAQLLYNQHEIVVKRADGASALLVIGQVGAGTYALGGQTLEPTPTTVSNGYVIPIGTTNSLIIQIDSAMATSTPTPTRTGPTPTQTGPTATKTPTPTPTVAVLPVPPGTTHIRFGVSLFAAENTPEITVRVRLTDLVARLTPPVNSPPAILSSCDKAGIGEYLYMDIPMVADGSGTYYPKGSATVLADTGRYAVTADGWVPLVGALANRPYSISVKAEKHRAHRLVHQIILVSGTPASQDLDLSAIPLEPGDLPDPNYRRAQDCTVNSIDLSLIISRFGSTDAQSLRIADVNYDNIVNGNDISKVVHTLSTKPDDDQ